MPNEFLTPNSWIT